MPGFGKDPNDLNRVIPFGGGTMSQRERYFAQQEAKARENRKAGGNAPFWKDTFRLPKDHTRMGRLIPGKYPIKYTLDGETLVDDMLEYVEFVEHRDTASKKTAICSAGPFRRVKGKREECLGCDKYWADKDHMSMTTRYAFNWFDYGLWLKLPSGNTNPTTGQPYVDWVPVPPNDSRVSQYESKWGNYLPWVMPFTHKKQLVGFAELTINNDCATCGGQTTISLLGKLCGNPQCRAIFCDMRGGYPVDRTGKPLDAPELAALSELIKCDVCGYEGYVIEILNCRNCQQSGATPKRATIFDEDLEVIAQLDGKGDSTKLTVLNRSNPRPIQAPDNIVQQLKPLPLDKKFTPSTIQQQAATWNIRLGNPATGAPSASTPFYNPQQAPYTPPFAPPPQAMPGAIPGMTQQPFPVPAMGTPQPMAIPFGQPMSSPGMGTSTNPQNPTPFGGGFQAPTFWNPGNNQNQ